MFCQKCGSEIGEGVAFCQNCGAPVAPAEPQSQAQYQQYDNQAQYQQYNNQAQYGQYSGPQYAQPVSQGAQKSKLAAGLLAIFLGSLGVHNFYLGFTKRAVAQLLISLLTFGIGAPIIAIWALIEGVFYLSSHEGYTTDANGVPLGE